MSDDVFRNVEMDIFVGLFRIRDQSSFSIEPDAIKVLNDLGCPLVFDMYT